MVGMEEFDPARRRDARARRWIAPPAHVSGAPALSTLLLFTADTSAQVETLDQALAHALTANDLRGTRRLGLYWEQYGVPHDSGKAGSIIRADDDSTHAAASDTVNQAAGDSSAVQVTVTRTDGGIAHWLSEALHITRRDTPIAVRWHDTQSAAMASHSVVLDLSQLPAGNYEVTVAAGPDDAHRTEVSREIRLN